METLSEMRKPGRKMWIQSGSGLLTMYAEAEPELRKTQHRQGTMVRRTRVAKTSQRGPLGSQLH